MRGDSQGPGNPNSLSGELVDNGVTSVMNVQQPQLEEGPAAHQAWVLAQLEENERPLLRYALRLMGLDDIARDVVQHCFLQLCDQSSAEIGEGARAWLFRVCRNRVIDLQRRSVVRVDQNQPAVDFDEQGGVTFAFSREPNPAEQVERIELCDRLWSLANQLGTTQREVVLLWCEGFTYREIATITGHTDKYVRVLAHRALQTLRQNPEVKSWLEDVGVARA